MVSIEPRLHAGQSRVQNLGEERDFPLMQIIQIGSGACPPPCSNYICDFDVKYQLQVRCSAFTKYFRTNGNTSV
jgi:hypothetical protein